TSLLSSPVPPAYGGLRLFPPSSKCPLAYRTFWFKILESVTGLYALADAPRTEAVRKKPVAPISRYCAWVSFLMRASLVRCLRSYGHRPALYSCVKYGRFFGLKRVKNQWKTRIVR